MSLNGSADSGGVLRGKVNGLDMICGYSAYELALINGFKGTVEEWLASLKGPKGDKGDPGGVSLSDFQQVQNSVSRQDLAISMHDKLFEEHDKRLEYLEDSVGDLSLTVTVTEQSNGTYTADMSIRQLYSAYQKGTLLFCDYKGIIMHLVGAYEAAVVFGCIYVDKVYRVSVFNKSVELVVTPLVSSTEDAVLYTPQTLTTEQQAQARQNIGACDEEFVRNAILIYDTEAMALLGEDGDGQ